MRNLTQLEQLIEYGTSYRLQELVDLLEYEDPKELADNISAFMIMARYFMTKKSWNDLEEILLSSASNEAFEKFLQEEDEEDSR